MIAPPPTPPIRFWGFPYSPGVGLGSGAGPDTSRAACLFTRYSCWAGSKHRWPSHTPEPAVPSQSLPNLAQSRLVTPQSHSRHALSLRRCLACRIQYSSQMTWAFRASARGDWAHGVISCGQKKSFLKKKRWKNTEKNWPRPRTYWEYFSWCLAYFYYFLAVTMPRDWVYLEIQCHYF